MATIINTVRWADNTEELKRNLLQGIDTLDAMKKSVDRTTEAMGGNGLLRAANTLTASIQQLGGVEKLTAAERDRANDTLQKALEKYQALGQTAPTAIQQLSAEMTRLKEAEDHSGVSAESLGEKLKQAFENPLGSAQSLAGSISGELLPALGLVGIVGGVVAAGLFELAERAASIGANLNDMSEKTGIAVPALSQLQNAAAVAGTDINTLSNAVFMMQKNMAESPDKFEKGLERLGIDATEFKALAPEKQLLSIADALKHTEDPVERNAAGFELMGRQFREIVPSLMKLNEAMARTADIRPFTEDEAKQAEEFEMQVAEAKLRFEQLFVTLGRDVLPVLVQAIEGFKNLKQFIPDAIGPLGFLIDKWALLKGVLGENALAMETAAAKQDVIDKAVSLGAPTTIAYGDAVKYVNDKFKELRGSTEDAAVDTAKLMADWQKQIDAAYQKQQNMKALAAALASQPGFVAGQTFDFAGQMAAQKAAEDEAKKLRQAQADLLAAQIPLTKTQIDQIEAYKKLKLSEDEIARLVGVHAIQIKVLDQAEKDEIETAKQRQKQIDTEAKLIAGDMLDSIKSLNRDLMGNADSWNTFHNGLTVAGDTIATVTIPLFQKLGVEVIPKSTKALEDAHRATDEAGQSFRQLQNGLNTLAGAFQQLSGVSTGTLSEVASDLAEGARAGAQFAQVMEQTAKTLKAAQASGGGLSASDFAGLAAGWVGVALTVFNVVTKLVEAHEAAAELARELAAAQGLARQFDSTTLFSDQLNANIRQTAASLQQMGVDITLVDHYATALSVGDIIKELGGISQMTANQIGQAAGYASQLFRVIQLGGPVAARAISTLDDTMMDFANAAAQNGGLVDRYFLILLQQARAAGVQLAQVSGFIKDQITSNVVGGVNAFTGAFDAASTKLADLQNQLANEKDASKVADLTKQIADQQHILDALKISSQGAGDAISGSLVLAWGELQRQGVPVSQIVDQLGPAIDQLGRQMAASGVQGGDLFKELQAQAALAKDTVAGPVIDALNGLGQTLMGLHNIDRLDQSTFSGLTEQFTASYQALEAQGKGGLNALRLLQQPLQTIWQLQHDFGLQVDDSTQKLLDQAQKAGIVGENMKPIDQQMLDATKRIADAAEALAHAFGVTLPSDAAAGAKGVQDALDSIKVPHINIPIETNPTAHDPGFTPPSYAARGGYVTSTGVQYFGDGGIVSNMLAGMFVPRGTDSVPAMLTPGETVLPKGAKVSGGDSYVCYVTVSPNIVVAPGTDLKDAEAITQTLATVLTDDRNGIRTRVEKIAKAAAH